MEIVIRHAVKQDCAAMMKLVLELAEYERASNEVTVSMEHFTESGFGNNPVWWAFVAEDAAGNIVGFALYYIRYSTWKGQRMYLEDILVTDDVRGKGIGAKLMERLLEECKDKKFSGMVWQVLNWNEPAIRFYKKFNTRFDEDWINCSIDF